MLYRIVCKCRLRAVCELGFESRRKVISLRVGSRPCAETVCWILFKYYDQLECRNVGVRACVYFHFPRRARLISADESAIKNGSTIQKQSAHMVLLWLCYMSASLQNRQEHALTSCSDHTTRCVQHYFKPAAVSYCPTAARWTWNAGLLKSTGETLKQEREL